MKIPISVLVVIYQPNRDVLLIERADRSGFWQSVTGSLDAPDENLELAAKREVFEETGSAPLKIKKFDYSGKYNYDKINDIIGKLVNIDNNIINKFADFIFIFIFTLFT